MMVFPTFVYGYKSIYAADLPVYVSADSVLYAAHHSYDKILELVETTLKRTVVAFMSANHLDPDIGAEIFVLQPDGGSPTH